jgi:4-hydroxy-tetrahydrodipicolinate synthase
MHFQGIFPILPTPFKENGDVDVESLRTLIGFMRRLGMDGVTILGVMGEAPKLSEAEQDLVVATVVEAAQGMPVIVGTGAASTRLALERSRRAAELGAAGFLVAPPKAKEEAIFNYYRELSEGLEHPIILHDYPEVTGVTLSVPLIARMARELVRVRYIKLEEAPTGRKITQLLEGEKSDIRVFGALGGVYCLEELRRGAVGIMTGYAYQDALKAIYQRHVAGDERGAEELFYRHVALMRYEFQPVLGLAIRKEIYRRRGAIRSAYIRPPGPSLDARHYQELTRILEHLGLED